MGWLPGLLSLKEEELRAQTTGSEGGGGRGKLPGFWPSWQRPPRAGLPGSSPYLWFCSTASPDCGGGKKQRVSDRESQTEAGWQQGRAMPGRWWL